MAYTRACKDAGETKGGPKAVAVVRAALAAAGLMLIVASCGGSSEAERTLFLDNQADERFIFRLFDEGEELRVTAAGITTNFAELPPLEETPVTIADGVDLEGYTLVLRRGADVLAFQTVTKDALEERDWRLSVDATGFR